MPETINGYLVRRDFGDDEPRIHDLELARRLGYARPRKVRDLIAEMERDGKLSNIAYCPEPGRSDGRGRPASAFWLTEKQALKVIAKSETALADAILDEVIDVFVAVRRSGAVAPTRTHLLLAPVPTTWKDTFGTTQRAMWRLQSARPYPKRSPASLAKINEEIYRLLLGDDVYVELKARNPAPHRGRNHHQFISDEAKPGFLSQLSVIRGIAETSHGWADFKARIRWLYRARPMQLPLTTAA